MNAWPDAQAEDELIAYAQRGETQAYERLLEPYRALLHQLTMRLCPYGPDSAREELMQAGAIGLMQAAQRYDRAKGVRFITYAVPWVLGEMRGALRAASGPRGICSVSMDAQSQESGRALGETIPDDSVSEEAIWLRLALSRLGKKEQQVIALRYFEDRTQAETAHMLGSSQAQVSRMERRALDSLHALLG